MRRKEERRKQGHTNNKAKQHSTPKAHDCTDYRQSLFLRKMTASVMISRVSYIPPTDLPVVQNAVASPFNSTAITVQWEVRAMHTIHVAGVAVVMYNVHGTVIMWYM